MKDKDLEYTTKPVLTQQEKKIRLQAAVFGFLLGFVVAALIFMA